MALAARRAAPLCATGYSTFAPKLLSVGPWQFLDSGVVPPGRGSQRFGPLHFDRRSFYAAGDVPTTDATFRYRTFAWETSLGVTQEYEYIVAQQPSGGETAKRDALSALEAHLPRPPSGWSVVLVPSVSLAGTGKEEMRPLAAGLSQRGHRCYILEWPGWTADASENWALARCKPEELRPEYEDFWCQVLAHIAAQEASEVEKSAAGTSAPQLCIIGAGHSAIYLLQAVQALRSWHRDVGSADVPGVDAIAALAMLAPTWQTQRTAPFSFLPAARASRWIGLLLHSESRFARWFQKLHFSMRRYRKNFAAGPGLEHSMAVASWLFRRPRPYIQTDGAVMSGLLDPQMAPGKIGVEEALTFEDDDSMKSLAHGMLLLVPRVTGDKGESAVEIKQVVASPNKAASWQELSKAVTEWGQLSSSRVPVMPHEAAPSAVLFALDSWLLRASKV